MEHNTFEIEETNQRHRSFFVLLVMPFSVAAKKGTSTVMIAAFFQVSNRGPIVKHSELEGKAFSEHIVTHNESQTHIFVPERK
jgi:hypothetical protein